MESLPKDLHPVTLPSMGEGIQEASVVKWLKKVGDHVTKNEPLLEISTDKVDTEIASPAEGFLLAIFSAAGEFAQVDQLIALLGTSIDTSVPATLLSPVASKAAAVTTSRPLSASRARVAPPPIAGVAEQLLVSRQLLRVSASPLACSLAREYQIPLAEISGTGLSGRITKDDVLDHAHQHLSRPRPLASPLLGESPRLTTTWQGEQEYLEGTSITREPMTRIRRLTAEHMLRSLRTSPHVTTTFEIDLDKVRRHRQAHQAAFTTTHGFSLSYTPYFLYAAALALVKHPEVNAALDGEEILWRKEINIGCAVATPRGLLVPVLKNLAGGLELQELAARLGVLVQRARDNKLLPEDVHGGTFTLTNPGMFGSLHSQPIINQPQVAILSIGAILDKPVLLNGAVVARPLCQLGLTFDHRLIDGEGGAKFLATIKEILESLP